MKLEVHDLLLPALIGMWLVFVLTGLVLGWGTGYVMAAVVWLVVLGLIAKTRR